MKDSIRHLIQQALVRLTDEGVLPAGLTPAIQVENTRDKSHGDFASNIAMMLAKPAGLKPRDLAEKLITALPQDAQISKVEIAGPGFLNFFQNSDALAGRLEAALADPHLSVRKAGAAQRVVIDLSSPNLAKEMHVGHLRSTIIGDAVGRVLEHLGDEVIRQNHVGDWGTQFGMLLAYLEEKPAAAESELSDLEQFYRTAKQRFDESAEFADRARELVVKLQAGDAQCLGLWTRFNDISLSHCQKIYDRLNVKLTPADVKGESAYNADLAGIVESLREKGLLTESFYSQMSNFYGARYNDDEGDDISDLSPKAVLQLLGTYIGQRGVPLVFDTSANEEVWNFPAWAYQVELNETTAADAEPEAEGGPLVNVNTADLEELSSVEGLNKDKAEKIIAYRELNGPFQELEELQKVEDIDWDGGWFSSPLFERLAPLLTVEIASALRSFEGLVRVKFATDGVDYQHVDADPDDPNGFSKTWSFTLEADPDGRLTSGSWLDEQAGHPDFAWVPYANTEYAGRSENPYLSWSLLKELLPGLQRQ